MKIGSKSPGGANRRFENNIRRKHSDFGVSPEKGGNNDYQVNKQKYKARRRVMGEFKNYSTNVMKSTTATNNNDSMDMSLIHIAQEQDTVIRKVENFIVSDVHNPENQMRGNFS